MATMGFAMWLQDTDPGDNRHLILIFGVLIVVVVVVMAIILMMVATKALGAIKDLSTTAEEVKRKVLPLLDEVRELSKTGREVLEDAAPKVKLITENLARTSDTLMETSRMARSTVGQIDVTLADANLRAQRQVVRVDGMVTAALTTTAEVAEAIGNGIRVPVQKVAVIATQAKVLVEGLLAKVKLMAARKPSAGR
jgi:flagellar basal body-associated protein FliL